MSRKLELERNFCTANSMYGDSDLAQTKQETVVVERMISGEIRLILIPSSLRMNKGKKMMKKRRKKKKKKKWEQKAGKKEKEEKGEFGKKEKKEKKMNELIVFLISVVSY